MGKMVMAYEVLARKWRPQVFQDVVGQEHVTQTLINAIKAGRLAHGYLFSGARGVGKTSVARILAKAINCVEGEAGIPCNRCPSCLEITNGSSVDVQEIDGASNRGIDEIRELRENIKYMPSSSRFRIYIIDEVHMLTLPAFNALLKTLEEPPPHVKFIFATTEPHKVPVTILSRCQRFEFKRISFGQLVQQLEKITTEEGIQVSKSGLALLARAAEGSMRDAESLLDQVVSFTGPKVEDKHITEILGLMDKNLVLETSRAILEGDASRCLDIVDQVYNHGYDMKEFYRALMDQFRNLLVCHIGPDEEVLHLLEDDREELKRQADLAGREKLQQALNLLIAREESLRLTSHPRLVLEIILIKLSQLDDVLSFDALIQKIEALEKRLVGASGPGGREPATRLSDPGLDWEVRNGDATLFQKPDDALPSKEDWDMFLEDLSSKNRAMANVLREWPFLDAKDHTLKIGRGGNAFSAGYLDEPDRYERLMEYCRDYFKRDLKIKVVDAPKPKKEKQAPEKAGKEGKSATERLPQPVQDVIEVFQGELKGRINTKRGGKGTKARRKKG
jgi:DNA polymerase-3 subunit gamma/tau